VRCASAMLVPASLPRLRPPSMAVSASDLRRPQLLVLAALGRLESGGLASCLWALIVGRLEIRHSALLGKGSRAKSRRLKWDSPATNDLPITMRLAEPPEPCDLVRSA